MLYPFCNLWSHDGGGRSVQYYVDPFRYFRSSKEFKKFCQIVREIRIGIKDHMTEWEFLNYIMWDPYRYIRSYYDWMGISVSYYLISISLFKISWRNWYLYMKLFENHIAIYLYNREKIFARCNKRRLKILRSISIYYIIKSS